MRNVWTAPGSEKIKAWVFGHTHWQYDFITQGIRFVTNPRGYRSERRKTGGVQGLKQIDTDELQIGSAFGEIE